MPTDLPIKEISLPILFLTKTMMDSKMRDGRRVDKNEDVLVKLSDVQKFNNYYLQLINLILISRGHLLMKTSKLHFTFSRKRNYFSINYVK